MNDKLVSQPTFSRGSGWVATRPYGKKMSPLGIAVADLVGDVFSGIYHLEDRYLAEVDWSNPYWIEMKLDITLCTVDPDHLTRFIVLGHDRMIRIEVQGGSYRHRLLLVFHQRHSRTGSMMERHPTLEEHAQRIRGGESRLAGKVVQESLNHRKFRDVYAGQWLGDGDEEAGLNGSGQEKKDRG